MSDESEELLQLDGVQHKTVHGLFEIKYARDAAPLRQNLVSLVLIHPLACCSCVSLMYCVHSDLPATVRPQFLPVMLLLQLMAMHPACIHGHSSLDASGESLVPSGPAENNDRTHALSRFTLCVDAVAACLRAVALATASRSPSQPRAEQWR